MQRTTAGEGEVVVVLDFKDNLRLGGGPVETGLDYYTKTQVTCLDAAVYIGGISKQFNKK